jgi:hypothetical protein
MRGNDQVLLKHGPFPISLLKHATDTFDIFGSNLQWSRGTWDKLFNPTNSICLQQTAHLKSIA